MVTQLQNTDYLMPDLIRNKAKLKRDRGESFERPRLKLYFFIK